MRRLLIGALALVLIAAGGLLVIRSMPGAGDEATSAAIPLPSRTFSVASPTPDEVVEAVVSSNPDDEEEPATEPVQEPTPAPLDPAEMAPSRLYIPSLGIYASLTTERFRGGSLTLPSEPWRVGQDVDSARLGSDAGVTLLAGHVDLAGTPGALRPLADLQPGALIFVTDSSGGRHDFVATSLQTHLKTGLPRSLFAVTGARQLAIVTCGGPIIEVGGERHYRDNVVVTAIPA